MDLLTCASLRSETRLSSPPQEYVLYCWVNFCYNWRQHNHVFFRDRYLSNENRLITVFNSKQSRLFFRLIGFGKLLGLVAFLISACVESKKNIKLAFLRYLCFACRTPQLLLFCTRVNYFAVYCCHVPSKDLDTLCFKERSMLRSSYG